MFAKTFFKSHGPLLFKSINSMRLSYSNTIRRRHCDYHYYFFLGSLSPSFVHSFLLSLSLSLSLYSSSVNQGNEQENRCALLLFSVLVSQGERKTLTLYEHKLQINTLTKLFFSLMYIMLFSRFLQGSSFVHTLTKPMFVN